MASATVIQSLFFTAVSVLMVIAVAIARPRTVSKGSPSDETGGFFASHPVLLPIIVIVAIGVVVFLWPRLKPRLLNIWHEVKEGAAIFRDRRRYAREVALPSGASFGCRIGVNVVFMAAFGIPITAFTVFLVASSHMLSQLFSITPRRGRSDPGSRRRHATQVCVDERRRGVLGHAGCRHHHLERRTRRHGHAVGIRLQPDEGALLRRAGNTHRSSQEAEGKATPLYAAS